MAWVPYLFGHQGMEEGMVIVATAMGIPTAFILCPLTVPVKMVKCHGILKHVPLPWLPLTAVVLLWRDK